MTFGMATKNVLYLYCALSSIFQNCSLSSSQDEVRQRGRGLKNLTRESYPNWPDEKPMD